MRWKDLGKKTGSWCSYLRRRQLYGRIEGRKALLASFDNRRGPFQNSSAFVTAKLTGGLGATICTTKQKLQIVRSRRQD